MRIYVDPLEMIKEVERDLFEMGVRYQSSTVQDQNVANDPGYRTIELSGYAYTLTGFDPGKMVQMMKYLGNNIPWAKEEATERIFRNDRCFPNPGEAWELDRKRWSKFIRDGFLAYSYAERWQAQLEYVIRELKLRPNTRQALMTMYDRHEDLMNWGGRDRVPCSLTYQFIQRDGKMTLIYNQRSCDFIGFFATDVFITCELLKHVARVVGAVPDRFIHFVGSLHSFEKDLRGRKIF